MASVVYHFNKQLLETGRVRLFDASHGVSAGEQRRDFVHVEDVVDMTLWCGETGAGLGILNCGTGVAATFNQVARAILEWHGRGSIEYIPFPSDLLGAYQSRTCADLGATRAAGYRGDFRPVAAGFVNISIVERVRQVYSTLYLGLLPFVLLRLWWRGRRNPAYRKRWLERLGRYPAPPNGQRPFWIHAVSVGEVAASAPLVKALRTNIRTSRTVHHHHAHRPRCGRANNSGRACVTPIFRTTWNSSSNAS